MIIKNSICEFDIKNAGVTILYQKGILTKKEYLYYINLDKNTRVIKTGNLLKDNPSYYKIQMDGFKEYMDKFILANKIKKYSVYEIAKDALWIIGRQPRILKFDNVLFVKKREFTSFFKYRKIIFYINSSTNIIDIRGSNPKEDKFLNIIKDILIKYEFGIDLYDKLHSIRNNLIDDSLYYGEPVIKGVDNIKIIERLIKEILWFEKTYFLKRIHYICV